MVVPGQPISDEVAAAGRQARLPPAPSAEDSGAVRVGPGNARRGGDRGPVFKRWADEGINIARVYLAETKKRGLECFYSYRITSDDMDENRTPAEAHPESLIEDEFSNKRWDFTVPEVRQFELAILRELAEDYDFDGLELDIEAFGHLIGGKPIKLLATLDDHHTSDGYSWPGIKVMRGVIANWWQQGIDGIQTFNWGVTGC